MQAKRSQAPEVRFSEDDYQFIRRRFYDDPLRFVIWAYPWGEPGELEHETGPDDNQARFLRDLGEEVRKRGFNGRDPVMPIQLAENSGHGTGKSSMGAWIANWILSTRRYSIGTVTAGTYTQLESRTWAAIRRWTKLLMVRGWFDIGADSIKAKTDPETWKILAQTCKAENAQSFAGQHAKNSTSWYLFDEASEVPDAIWETAKGGLTDGEPMWFAWGQPVRNSGAFHRVCFGSEKDDWIRHSVDSRTSRFANKPLIEKWIQQYGIDSDFVRVRVLGQPPLADELQFIDNGRVNDARKRAAQALKDEPLIAGFDVSGGGAAWNVIRFRRGLDARSIAPVRITGEQGRDRSVLVGVAAELLRDQRPGRKIAALFIDSAFGAAIYERLKALGFNNVFEVNFGGRSPDPHQFNWRAYMWAQMKDWLLRGAIPDEEDLALQLTGPGYHINQSSKLVIESKEDMKERGIASPDDADALALTFAQPVAPPEPEGGDDDDEMDEFAGSMYGSSGWMRG
jgi:hypothetical protein